MFGLGRAKTSTGKLSSPLWHFNFHLFFHQIFKKRLFLFFISRYFNFGNKKKEVPKSKIKRTAIETKIENKLIFNSAQGSNKKM